MVSVVDSSPMNSVPLPTGLLSSPVNSVVERRYNLLSNEPMTTEILPPEASLNTGMDEIRQFCLCLRVQRSNPKNTFQAEQTVGSA